MLEDVLDDIGIYEFLSGLTRSHKGAKVEKTFFNKAFTFINNVDSVTISSGNKVGDYEVNGNESEIIEILRHW